MQTESQETALSRADLLAWINDLLKLNLAKVEQLGTGAVHCQILDVIFPGKVPLHKVNWRAKFEYEFVYNFKILQQSFTKFNIPKYIDVERLIKARYQDNLEFAQWMHRYFQAHCTSWKDYDAIARRGNIEPDLNFVDKASIAKASVCKESVAKFPAVPNSKPKSILAPRSAGLRDNALLSQRSGSMQGGSTSNLFSNLMPKDNEILSDLHNMIERQKADKNPQLEILRAERDFYYSKLRDIDHILDVFAGNNIELLMNNIREVLYLTPEKIAIVCEDGNVKIQNKNDDERGDNKENRDENLLFDQDFDTKPSQSQPGNRKEFMLIEDDE